MLTRGPLEWPDLPGGCESSSLVLGGLAEAPEPWRPAGACAAGWAESGLTGVLSARCTVAELLSPASGNQSSRASNHIALCNPILVQTSDT